MNELLEECNIDQDENNQSKSKSNSNSSVNIENIRFFAHKKLPNKRNVHKESNDKEKSISDKDFYVDFGNVFLSTFTHIAFLSSYARTKENIAASMLAVNKLKLTDLGILEVAGTINTAPIHPAAKLTNKSEKIKSQFGSTTIFLV